MVLSTAGLIAVTVLGLLLILFCLLLPDMVYAQRSGVMLGLTNILGMRLRVRPVWLLIDAAAALRDARLYCAMPAIEHAYAQSKDSILGNGQLVQLLRQSAERGDIDLLPMSDTAFAKNLQPDFRNYRSLGVHVRNLIGAAVALVVLGFFFTVTDGIGYMDIMLLHRDWQETDAVITKTIRGYRSQATRHFFTYQLDGRSYSTECFGPVALNDKPARARYDRNHPNVAVLVGGMRVQSLPIWTFFFGGLILLVLFGALACTAHLAACVLAGVFPRRRV